MTLARMALLLFLFVTVAVTEANGQIPPQPTETAVLSGWLHDGETIPLPVFANGDTASEAQSEWIVSSRKFLAQFSGQVYCYTTGRVVRVISEGGMNDPATEANFMIIAQRAVPLPTFPPAPRQIVAAGDGVAVDSDGNLFISVGANNAPCLTNAGATLRGNLFGGPPPSPVIGVWQDNGSPYVLLQNGDLYYWCTYALPAPGQPVFAGNIFSAAGITAIADGVPTSNNALLRSYPNPSNPGTEIPYSLERSGRATIRIYDASGRLVRTLTDSVRPAGRHTVRWDGRSDSGVDVSSGAYFSRITYPDGSHGEGKLTVVR